MRTNAFKSNSEVALLLKSFASVLAIVLNYLSIVVSYSSPVASLAVPFYHLNLVDNIGVQVAHIDLLDTFELVSHFLSFLFILKHALSLLDGVKHELVGVGEIVDELHVVFLSVGLIADGVPNFFSENSGDGPD